MDVFDDMRVFISVVERGSFSEAGRALRMSPALVSSRIGRLEAHLGVTLFNRTTRKVTTTEAGLRYYDDSLDIRRRVEEAESRLFEDEQAPKGILKVTSSSSFGNAFLVDKIPEFAARYPDIQLQYRMTDALVDILADGIDVSVRIGPLVDSSLKSRILAPCPRYIFASPDYLTRAGTPQTPQELEQHNCLMLRFPGSRQYRWRFEEKGNSYELPVTGSLDSNNGDVLTQWALAGMGLIFKTYWEVVEHVASGKLVPVLTKFMPDDAYIAALYPYDRYVPPRVRVFIDFLAEEVKAASLFHDQGVSNS